MPDDDRGRKQRQAGQQVDADRGAEELGEVGRHRDRLGLEPEQERGASRELLAAHLRQVAPRRDAELRRQRLDQHREQVGGDDHPDEAVAEPRAAGDVRREVAGVDVGDAGDERRPEERQDPEAGAVEGLVDRAEALGQLLARDSITSGV